ncbi:MAG: hypothetical protein PGN23_15460 [Sphingomonas adhaesiva]|uniref:hypothetical protein n=1 Tax=Sphingomonas adhaesiva TaxID=28212 RepID=UPI002FF9627E
MTDPWNVVAAVGGAVSAAAAVATLVILVRTNANQRADEDPLIEVERQGQGETATITLTAINRSRARWMLEEVRIVTPISATIATQEGLHRYEPGGSFVPLPAEEYDKKFSRTAILGYELRSAGTQPGAHSGIAGDTHRVPLVVRGILQRSPLKLRVSLRTLEAKPRRLRRNITLSPQ